MDKSKDEELTEKIEQLPEEARRAIIWAITHWELVELLCKDAEMTHEEAEKMKIQAIERQDYVLLVLICAAQAFSQNDDNKAPTDLTH